MILKYNRKILFLIWTKSKTRTRLSKSMTWIENISFEKIKILKKSLQRKISYE